MATISAAYAALPSCSLNNFRANSGRYETLAWSHCGAIEVGPGTFTVSSQVSIASPFVVISGRSPVTTVLAFTGSTGSAINWTAVNTSNPAPDFGDEFMGTGGLYNLTIDGFRARTGTFGLTTNDISGFHALNVAIQNFSGSGSVCWNDTTANWYNEKYDIEMSLKNCATAWLINPGSSSSGYPGTTFGYGRFVVKCGVFLGQTCLQMNNGILSASILDLTINQVQPNSSGIVLLNSARIFQDLAELHIEAPFGVGTGSEISVPSTSAFGVVGMIDQDYPTSNVNVGPGSPQYWPSLATNQNSNTLNPVARLYPCPTGGGVPGCNAYDLNAIPQSTYVALTLPNASGTLALDQLGITGSIGGTFLSAGGCATGTAAIASSATGHAVAVSESGGTFVGSNYTVRGTVSGTTVTVHVCAITAGTPAAQTYNVAVF